MTLRLDPRWPLVWRDPFTLQIGIDPPLVVLQDLTTVDEKIVAALAVGITRDGLEVLDAGAAARADDLLERLSPALLAAPSGKTGSVAVAGTGRTADLVAGLLRDGGHEVARGGSDRRPDIAVVVGHWVLAPELHSYWLRRDVAHLPVVLTDSAVHVGPLIEPGEGPCLLCLELYRRDGDEAWPAIATQLLGRAAGAEHPVLVAEAAAAAVRIVERRLAVGPGAAQSVRIAADGSRIQRDWAEHPECGCRGIAHLVIPATGRSGTDSAGAASAPVRRLPTTGPGAAWPA